MGVHSAVLQPPSAVMNKLRNPAQSLCPPSRVSVCLQEHPESLSWAGGEAGWGVSGFSGWTENTEVLGLDLCHMSVGLKARNIHGEDETIVHRQSLLFLV